MQRYLFLCLGLLISVSLAKAEQVTVNYTEPTASATLAYTTVYWCIGSSCTDFVVLKKETSDNGNGGDAKSVPLIVPLVQGTLPITIRVKITATSTSQNENSGVIVTHTFN